MTVVHTISSPIQAAVLQQLELDGDTVVTLGRLVDVMDEVGVTGDPNRLAYSLQRSRWLGRLRTRGAWEFLPAARGGPISSGDRFIEFRAQRLVDSSWPGALAMESAAVVLGLSQRIPNNEVVVLPQGVALPKAMVGEWRSVGLSMPRVGVSEQHGLPTLNLEGLLYGIAVRPSGYRDVPGLGQWISSSGQDIDIEVLKVLVAEAPMTVRQRLAYLVGLMGDRDGRDLLIQMYPPTEVAWMGSRAPGGTFDSATQVNDTMLHRYVDVGTGS